MCRCRSVGAGVFRRYQAGGWEVSRNRCSPRGALVLAHEQFFEGGGGHAQVDDPETGQLFHRAVKIAAIHGEGCAVASDGDVAQLWNRFQS